MRLLALTVLAGAAFAQTTFAADGGGEDLFLAKIKPLLEHRCLTCHGADEPEGGLRLLTRDLVLKGGESGPALIPGDPIQSLLVKAIKRQDKKLQMPPKNALPAEDVAAVEAWVKAGAPWPKPLSLPGLVAADTTSRIRGFDGAGPMPLRRLNREEYLATVSDLLGTPIKLTVGLPDDPLGPNGFASPGVVSQVETKRFLAAAEELGVLALPHLLDLLPCSGDPRPGDSCARAFVTDFGRRAFRRPLHATEIKRYLGLYTQARTKLGVDFNNGVRFVLQAFLQAPGFLYHFEDGPTGAVSLVSGPLRLSRLSPFELASRLSYLLVGSMPDDELFAAAARGDLDTASGIESQARRLLASPRAEPVVLRFFTEWLHLQRARDIVKDLKKFPLYSPKLALAMEEETRTFLRQVFFEGDARYETLFTATYSFINEGLAKLYGVKGVRGRELRRVDLDPAERAGVLTHGSFLAVGALPNSGSPVKRGKTVLEDILCMPPPPPPEGLDVTPPKPDPNAQTRELYSQHVENKVCRSCHRVMDPVGFAFENYDALGAFRKTENNRPVDTTGVMHDLAGGDRPFTDARQLSRLLSQSEEGRRCVVKKWMRFALGRMETVEEAPSIDAVYTRFANSQFDLRELVIAVTSSRAFVYRTAPSELALRIP